MDTWDSSSSIEVISLGEFSMDDLDYEEPNLETSTDAAYDADQPTLSPTDADQPTLSPTDADQPTLRPTDATPQFDQPTRQMSRATWSRSAPDLTASSHIVGYRQTKGKLAKDDRPAHPQITAFPTVSRNSPMDQTVDTRGLLDVTLPVDKTLCWRCGFPGHLRHGCTRPRLMFCSRCGAIGIMSRDCPCKGPEKNFLRATPRQPTHPCRTTISRARSPSPDPIRCARNRHLEEHNRQTSCQGEVNTITPPATTRRRGVSRFQPGSRESVHTSTRPSCSPHHVCVRRSTRSMGVQATISPKKSTRTVGIQTRPNPGCRRTSSWPLEAVSLAETTRRPWKTAKGEASSMDLN